MISLLLHSRLAPPCPGSLPGHLLARQIRLLQPPSRRASLVRPDRPSNPLAAACVSLTSSFARALDHAPDLSILWPGFARTGRGHLGQSRRDLGPASRVLPWLPDAASIGRPNWAGGPAKPREEMYPRAGTSQVPFARVASRSVWPVCPGVRGRPQDDDRGRARPESRGLTVGRGDRREATVTA